MKEKVSLKTLQDLDTLLKMGMGGAAQVELKKLFYATKQDPHLIAREHLAYFAGLLRRVGLSFESISLLHKEVRGTPKTPPTATDSEKAEYAASLIFLGLIEEGQLLLKKIPSSHSLKNLYSSFASIAQWDYKSAIPLLHQFISQDHLDPYFKLVASVNLLSAFSIEEQFQKTKELFEKSLLLSTKLNAQFLQASIYEIYSQSLFFQKKFDESLNLLVKADQSLQFKESRQAYLIQKWTLASLLALKKIKQESFLEFQKKMLQKSEFEIYRDCDFLLAHLFQEFQTNEHLQKLYFGTPFLSYKNRLKNHFKDIHFTSYKLTLTQTPLVMSKKTIKKHSLNSVDLEKNALPYKLIQILISDFYKPFSIPSLHAKLFSGDFYNPDSGNNRVRQAIFRTRKIMIQIGLAIKEDKSLYSIQAAPENEVTLEMNELKINPLLQKLDSKKSYNIRELASIWKCSVRTALRRVNEEIKNGQVISTGNAKAKKYKLTE